MPPHASARLRSRARERSLVALGFAVGLGLIVAAFQDFGDPREAARARTHGEARLACAAVDATWRELALSDRPPPGAGQVLRVPPTEAATETSADRAARSDRPKGSRTLAAGSVLDAGLSAGARGEAADAIALFSDALALGGEDFERRFEAHLALARVWSRLDEPVTAGVHRRLAAAAPPTVTIDGLPVALLAHLLEPIDGGGARDALEAGAGDVLWPDDSRLLMVDGGLRVAAPPRARAVRRKLESVLDCAALDVALDVEGRTARAVRALLTAEGVEPHRGEWSVHRLQGAEFVARGDGDGGLRVAPIDRAALWAHLAGTSGEGLDPDLVLHLDRDRHTSSALFGPAAVPGLDAFVSADHPAPERSAGPEIRRLRLVRGGLLALALMTAAAALLGARSLAQERRLAELRSTFVASVSHDLRTPAQAILLLAEALDEKRVAGEASRARYHGEIRREAERLRRLVEDLLDGARIERGEGPRVARVDVATEPFLDGFEREATARAERAGAALTITRSSIPATLHFDPDGVRRAVWNLFENALLHGHAAGETARVRMRFALERGALVVTVDDEGPGIPAKLRESIFEPFERVRDRAAGIEADTGTGLGLSIVRAIAVAHGGEATVSEGAASRGARFVATFGTPRTGEVA